jgi:HlyD family secretion protein
VVYEIANTGTSRGLGTQEEVTNFEVKMRILDNMFVLRPGMSMTADIETETKQGVLTVPIQSVTTRGPKKQEMVMTEGADEQGPATNLRKKRDEIREVVFLVKDGLARIAPVKRGISDDAYVEITEGLDEGMEVVSGSYKVINRELEDSTKVTTEEVKKEGSEEKKSENG